MTTVASVFEALERCARTRTWEINMCGQFCAAMYGYGSSGYLSALVQWNEIPAAERHPGDTHAPPGSLLFWGVGNGHVAVSDGFGNCFSIDISGPGTVSLVPASMISQRWGKPYLGWTRPYFQGAGWKPVSIYGIDVSMYQPINFSLTTPGDDKKVDFAIIKVTEGSVWASTRWTAQRQWAKDHGLSVGFYHFARPGDMVAQADRFLDQIALQPGDHLWFDWEDAGVTNTQKDAWISYVQGKARGHRVGLYCNTDFWKNRDTTGFAGDGLWIATGGYPAGAPPIKSNWLIHQYSTAGGYDHDTAQFATRADMITWAQGGDDVALSDADKTWITNTIKTQVAAALTATSLVDSKAHGAGYYLARTEKALADVLAAEKAGGTSLSSILSQSQTNGTNSTAANTKLDEIRATLAALDLSRLPDEIAAKLEALKLNITITEG